MEQIFGQVMLTQTRTNEHFRLFSPTFLAVRKPFPHSFHIRGHYACRVIKHNQQKWNGTRAVGWGVGGGGEESGWVGGKLSGLADAVRVHGYNLLFSTATYCEMRCS